MKRVGNSKYIGTIKGVPYMVKKAGKRDWRLYIDQPFGFQISATTRSGLVNFLQRMEETAS